MTGKVPALELVEELRRLPGCADVTVDPAAVRVRPAGAEAELGGVLRLARRYGVRVSTMGDAGGGIYLCLDRLGRVVSVDREKLCLVVEPHADALAVRERLAREGLGLPADPCLTPGFWYGRETMAAYAATRRLLGVEAVGADGRPFRLGGPGGGGQAEIGLARLILGADGEFGVATRLYLQLGRQRPVAALVLATFRRVEEAGAALFALAEDPGLRGRAGPDRLECLDLGLLRGGHGCDLLRPFAGCGGMLVMETAGGAEDVEDACTRAGTICRAAGALDVLAADNPSARQRARKVREHYLTFVAADADLRYLGGPPFPEWPGRARAGGLTVPYVRLEEGALCMALGGEDTRLSTFLGEARRMCGPDDSFPDGVRRVVGT